MKTTQSDVRPPHSCRNRTASLGAMAALTLTLAATGVHAQPMSRDAVPDELRSWVPWVLQDVPEAGCPLVQGSAVCAWPGELRIDVDSRAGSFSLEVLTDRALDVELPGSAKLWPERVLEGKTPLPVLERDGVPTVALTAGVHQIFGTFSWKERPEWIDVPESIARVSLRVDGKAVADPERNDQGELWLRSGSERTAQEQSLEVDVFRRLEDGVPMTMTTRIVLRAAGSPREIRLGNVLPAGLTPLSIVSELPVRWDRTTGLTVQLRTGTNLVEVTAHATGKVEKLAAPKLSSPWPADEIWTWAPNAQLSEIKLGGAPAIDPARTELPDEWKKLAAYKLSSGQAMTFVTSRRGQPNPPPNSLTLTRELWLDLDGDGYTGRDVLQGRLNSGFRLSLVHGELGHVAVSGSDRLITVDRNESGRGIELRDAAAQIAAEWRDHEATSSLPAVGWSDDVQQLSATLHLPPGWELLAASGVDNVPNTWWSSWDLFEFFFVLLVAVAVFRITHRIGGVIALVTLVLCHNETEAPFFVWLALIVSIALLRVLPHGIWRRAVQVVWASSAFLLVAIGAEFAATEVRSALYPQTEGSSVFSGDFAFSKIANAPRMDAAPAAPPPSPAASSVPMAEEKVALGGASGLRKADESFDQRKEANEPVSQTSQRLRWSGKTGAAKGYVQSNVAARIDPDAVIQMGPAVPTWSWRTWQLSWSGPVDRTHTFRLFLLSPWQKAVLSFARVALIALLAWILWKASQLRASPLPRKTSNRPPKGGAAAATLLALVGALSLVRPANAQTPTPEVLNELKERLTRPPRCAPDCVSIGHVQVDASADTLRVTATVDALAKSSVPLPGPASEWVPSEVRVDGKVTQALVLLDDGHIHLRLEPGSHRVELSGPLAGDELALGFAMQPHYVVARGTGWEVAGVEEDGSLRGALHFVRKEVTQNGASKSAVTVPPWLEITRTFHIGVHWSVETVVRRQSPEGTPVVVRFPLLSSESVTDSNVSVEKGTAVVSLDRSETQMSFSSTLKTSDRIDLHAARGGPWSEVWVLDCGEVWHCEAKGLPPVEHVASGRFQPSFRPWPGEKLTFEFRKPKAAPGASVTIDSSTLVVSPGVRLSEVDLTMALRTSQGGLERIRLPRGARVQKVEVGGLEYPVRVEGHMLSVSVPPGTQTVHVHWQQPGGMTLAHHVPEVSVGRPIANARVIVRLPPERWLIWAHGPSWGPAILFWGFLLLVIAVAFALSRLSWSPLRFWQWALLGLGLTQIPVPAALVIVGWFFAIEWRKRFSTTRARLHNLVQVLFVSWTVFMLGCLFVAVHEGLLVQPDMQVQGTTQSAEELLWYVDRASGAMPTPWVWSAPLWVWRVILLGWSLWLAFNLVRWLRRAWSAFTHGGLWQKRPPSASAPARVTAPFAPPSAPAAPVAPSPSASAFATTAGSTPPPSEPDGKRPSPSKPPGDGDKP